MKMKKTFRHIYGVLIALAMVTFSFTAPYFIMNFIYHLSGIEIAGFARYFINVILGFIILGVAGYSISKIIRSKQRNLFQEVIEALKKIANGDFTIQLETLKQEDPFKTLIDHINHMAKQLKQMEEMRQEFISNVSHEIQSPLTSIMGFAKALQSDQLTREEKSHYLGIIETESSRLSKLSDNLLKLTFLESGHHPFEQKSYQLDRQIRNTILACEPHWMEKELDMDVSLEKVMITADQELMNQVWTNLLHNSIKFTHRFGVIRISLQQVDERAIIKIADTGIGISEKDLPYVFERFYKADKARDRSKGGSGLGLSIVKKIIDLHKGTIMVKSEAAEGTLFTISLPVK